MKTSIWCALGGALTLLTATPRLADAAGCPIPGFANAAFADVGGFDGRGTTDSWDSACGAYGSAGCPACTDPTSCSDPNSCGAGIGTNATGFGTTPATSGTCTASANITLTIPTVPALPVPIALGAVGSRTIATPPGGASYTATSISVGGNSSLDFVTAGALHGPAIVYVSGNISFSGQGELTNDSLNPSNVLIMCTNTSTSPRQQITLSGNGNAYFALYCPNADITLNGGGNSGAIWGAIVGYSINGNGNHALDVHYDKQLANLTTNAISCGGSEVSRSSPVIAAIKPSYGGAAVDSLVQGSFVPNTAVASTITTGALISSFTFPYYTGHMRATIASKVTATATTLSGTVCTASNTPAGCSVLFDAGATGKIPAANSPSTSACASTAGSCRYMFTNTNTTPTNGITFHPTKTVISGSTTTANLIGPLVTTGAVGPFTTANYQTLMTKILGAGLGGVDRSTVAVIPPSAVAGVGTRATMAYFGATDGMIHAVCASQTGACASLALGTELWAFLPRVQLPLIATKKTRIDGSVRVVDAFGDFTNNPATGSRSWHTVLTFQTGYAGTSKPAVYALDVTDPASPVILWEHTQPTTLGSTALGVGLTIAAGPSLVGGSLTNVAVVETNNGGTGGAGVYANALSLETGSSQWTTPFSYLFSTASRYSSIDQTVLARGIPGGAVGVDLTNQGYNTDFVMGDIFGNFWRLNAVNGTSRNGTNTPLFSFSTNYHPIGASPAIYSNGSQQFAAFASGGYVDPTAAGYSTSNQYLIAVKLASTAATVSESASACASCALTLNSTLTGSKGFSQVLVVGTQLFVTTSSVDINSSTYGSATTNTGSATVANLSTLAVAAPTAIFAGGSALASQGTAIYSSSSQKQQQMTAATTSVGTSVEVTAALKVFRDLWLRSE
ncbi:hypothetical protein BH11MYX3_BH11MYX3_03180 [soil metagenome]